MICANCAAENRDGAKFCGTCGASLAVGCPNCGAPVNAGQQFCDECGTPFTEVSPAAAVPAAAVAREAAPAISERRLVSVLFADLVGFTTLSEGRDSEQVRELQSQYFDTCRRLIELYGGTVEKFIGDAVMAVWGTPTATEDDAERAVRTALDLLAAVTALGDEVGIDDLRARAGVLTGEATVNLGATAEGMVTGDLVNSAARIQALAGPGQVLVGEATRRATEPTIAYDDAGSHELKGKAGLHRLWRAVRVVSGARGALKSEGLEAPFVGRDRELRQVKDLFHTCADERRAHLVSVTGIAGIGKSRLVWEFFKHIDGLPQIVYWHRGRCLSYGEGVTYWALADMVRMRCRIAEEEPSESVRAKLAEVLDEHLQDAGEREFVEPRVAHLLGVSDDGAYQREELFAAWRVFFERLADVNPLVLAFEDMQWADASLLDFIEHLLEWSRNSPVLVVTAARPELVEKRPTWGAGKRNFTSIYLEPLSEGAMRALLDGLVPGLPDGTRDQILARAEGVPLYAMETVRMLLDRGLLVQEGSVYRPSGEIASLEVPETLHALIAARLDGLTGAERRLVQDGAVLGKTFTKQALAALSDAREDELEPLLASLVRKEVLSIQADPRSPEHGQYGFLQDLVRHVAYETLSRRDRHARHLAAAAHIELTAPDDDDLVEVLASHYLDAHRNAPDGDGEQTRERARELLERAGRRAESLGAAAEAQRYYEQAAGLTEEDLAQAALLDRAGEMAFRAADQDGAIELSERARALFEDAGRPAAAARALVRIAIVESARGLLPQSIERLERAYEVLSAEGPSEDLASLTARLGSAYYFTGNLGRSSELVDRALDMAEAHGYPEALMTGWVSKAMLCGSGRRPEEARALFQVALELAVRHGVNDVASRCAGNLSDLAFRRDRYADALTHLEQARELARTVGSRPFEWFAISESTYALHMLGRWDEAVAAYAELPEEQIATSGTLLSPLTSVLEIHALRGDLAAARRLYGLYEPLEQSGNVQDMACFAAALTCLLASEGRHEDALTAHERAIEHAHTLGADGQDAKMAVIWAIQAAIALDDRDRARSVLEWVEAIPPGLRPPMLTGHAHRVRAWLEPDPDAAADERLAAVAVFRRLELPFWLAVALLEQAEAGASGAEASLAEALATFEALAATPWVERARAAAEAPVRSAAR